MSMLSSAIHAILTIFVVLMVFNIIIFVHELGHFLAAKWRGLQIDRFQIWFGKPIWKKEINGVQYGLGYIPAGGFVALPQMAPMEAIEGGEKPEKPLPPISALDKIIVAFAGPLFSMLLALAAAVIVWKVGKPKDFIPSQEIGYVLADSPAQKAGLKLGDKIIAINGEPVSGFRGSLNSISERIILSRGEKLTLTIERPGVEGTMDLVTGFETQETRWFQRGGLRHIGIDSTKPAIIDNIIHKSPADTAGLKKGDRITSIDGQALYGLMQFSQYLRDHEWKTVHLGILTASGEQREVDITPIKPLKPEGLDPMIGIEWDMTADIDIRLVNPKPFDQVTDSLSMMWTTITSVISPKSSIGISHLSGPIGIGTVMFDFLQMENGWRRILAFVVLFNVNLAVLNMLPFPVLDGGHITLAILEKIAGRPVKAKPLEILQTICALLLISLMLFVSSKDVGDRIGGGKERGEVVFPE